MSAIEDTNTTVVAAKSASPEPRERPRRLAPAAAFVGAIVAFIGIPFAAGAPSPLFVLYQREWHFADWTLTFAFAIYAFTLLVALLVAGSLSDHIGRRPVLIGALILQLTAMLIFAFAPNIGWIIIARIIQGVATGAATSTFTATIVELAPARHRKFGALVSSVAPLGGLALGALVSGIVVQFTVDPGAILFGFLSIFFVGGIAVVLFAPETVTRRAGAVRSLIPRLSVPRVARTEYLAGVPVLVAGWMLSGLFLGLAPSINAAVFHISSGLVNGVVVALQPAAAAVTGLIFGRFTARRAMLVGSGIALLGTALTVLAIASAEFPLLIIGAIVAGAGIGASFSGALRQIGPLAAAHQRAELFAAIYLVSYLAYGAPAIIAGELIGVVGIEDTVIGYGAVVLVALVVGLVAQGRRSRSDRATLEAAVEGR
jgi:MFS family permease